jgi:hypothetical protein
MHALNILAWVGAAISWWGTIRYMIEIGRSNTQPRLASWIAWGTANSVLMIVALLNHNQMAAIFNGLAALGNISVLALSAVRHAGERPDNPTDWTCLSAAGLCLLAILMFPHMSYLDAILAMTANVIATWPTLQHAWQRPTEEAWQLFAANGGANMLGLVSVIAAAGMSLANIAGPLISMLGNVCLVIITVGRGWLTNVTQEVQEEIVEAEQYIAKLEQTAETEQVDRQAS